MSDFARQISRLSILRQARIAASIAVRALDQITFRQPFWLAACALVFFLQAALIIGHEPWLDEYQAVQLAVQAPDIETLFAWLHYEGHPPLFYLILRGLAHGLEPLQTLPALALICAGATQATILFCSPFSRGERLLIATSEFVLFDFLTLSRSLTLGVTLLILSMPMWRSRWIWLPIALLPLCDFLFGVLSGGVVLLLWREKRLWWPGVALWLALGALSAYSVLPASDMIPALMVRGFIPSFIDFIGGIGTLLLPFQGGILPTWNATAWPVAGILWTVFLWFAWAQTRGDALHRLILFAFIMLTFVFSMTVYPLSIRHMMLIALLLIILTWRRRLTGERPGAGFRLWLLTAAVCGLVTAAINFAMDFDTASNAVTEIRRLGLTRKHWMAYPEQSGQGLSALSGIDFERTQRHCRQSFIRWDYATDLMTPAQLEAFLREEIQRHGRFYLTSSEDMSGLSSDVLRQIVHVTGGYDGEDFYLYVVGPAARERNAILPLCVPHQRPFTTLP